MVGCEEALRIGLVDEVAPSEADLDASVARVLKAAGSIQPEVRATVKKQLRMSMVTEMQGRLEGDVKDFVSKILAPSLQAALNAYMEALAKRQQAK